MTSVYYIFFSHGFFCVHVLFFNAMLLQLKIKDFAIIDDLTIKFRPGLNVLTGETGAGKSIVVDAFGYEK